MQGVVNKTFLHMLEALGYDAELAYAKRKGDITGDTFDGGAPNGEKKK